MRNHVYNLCPHIYERKRSSKLTLLSSPKNLNADVAHAESEALYPSYKLQTFDHVAHNANTTHHCDTLLFALDSAVVI